MIGQRLCVLARQSRLCVGLVLAWALTFAGSAQAAGQDQVVTGHATGRIISADLCPYPLLCQETTVSGQLTHLGRFTGLLSEEVDVNTGHYTGTAVFTAPDASTIQTTYEGQALPPESGVVAFSETHEIVAGTRRLLGLTGELIVTGTADSAGRLSVDIVGALSR